MGVFLCLGQQVYNLNYINAIDIKQLKTFKQIHDYINENGKIFVFMGEGQHKIKRKAEQIACNEALIFNYKNEKEKDTTNVVNIIEG
jgi:hypothetical protein